MMVEEKGALNESDRALNKFLENLKSVFFFATPHSGSDAFEELAAKLNSEDENQMLHLLKVLNKETARIHQKFQAYRRGNSKRSRFTSYAVHPTHATDEGGFRNVVAVAEGSARSDVDVFYAANPDYFSVCQAEAKHSTPLQMLVKVINDEVEKAAQDEGCESGCDAGK